MATNVCALLYRMNACSACLYYTNKFFSLFVLDKWFMLFLLDECSTVHLFAVHSTSPVLGPAALHAASTYKIFQDLKTGISFK
jgi:hypothetical protein